MTGSDRSDDDLAPVTDLFGARSRRGRDTIPTEAGQSLDGGSLDDAPHIDETSDTDGGSDADGPAALVRPGSVTRPVAPIDASAGGSDDAGWWSPVVGDGSGRSARAETPGYDDATSADERTASVFAIADGSELDPADAPRPIEEQRAEAERASMKALGRKGVSTSEMRSVLTGRDLDPDVVESEIERLTRVGLLDDLALASDLVDRLHERKGLGRQGVVTELRRRGIEQGAIDQALDAAADDGDDELARAIEIAEKRGRQLRGLDAATAERRLAGFLMRKGYGSGVVRIAVERGLRGGGSRSGGSGGRGTVRFE